MGAIGLLLALFWGRLFEVPTKHKKANPAELAYIKAGGGLVELDADIRDANGQKQKIKGATLSEFGQLFKSRMLVGIFISQYCISSITWFFLSWFPIYLVKERGLSILEAGLVASIPAICGWIGGISSGFISDYLLKRTGSLSLASCVGGVCTVNIDNGYGAAVAAIRIVNQWQKIARTAGVASQ